MLDCQRTSFISQHGQEIFSSPRFPSQLWGPLNIVFNKHWWAVFPGVKQLGREADHSTSSSADVQIESSYTSSSHMPSRCAQCQLLSEFVQHLINRGTDTCFGKRMPNGSNVFGNGLK
jgi:hypothetical protein